MVWINAILLGGACGGLVTLVLICKKTFEAQSALNSQISDELRALSLNVNNLLSDMTKMENGLAEAADWAHQQDLFQTATFEKNARLRERLAQLIRIDRGIENISDEKGASNGEETKTEES